MKGAKCDLKKDYKKLKSFIEDYPIPVKKDPKNIL